MKPSLFMSYCRDDILPDDPRLQVIVNAIASNKRDIDVIFDGSHPKGRIGNSLNDFIQEINNADAAVIILGPGYLKRVIEQKSSGVHKEYDRIIFRQQEHGLKVFPLTLTSD